MFSAGRCLGIDPGDEFIRIVELGRRGTGYELLRAVRLPAGDGLPAMALWQFMLESGLDTGRAFCSIPTDLCTVKLSELPPARPDVMERMARFEAEALFPLPLNELEWGYAVGGASGEEMLPVLLGGTRRDSVEETISMLQGGGLQPAGITVAALAAVASIAGETAGMTGTLVLVLLQRGKADICLMHRGRMLSCRSVGPWSAEETDPADILALEIERSISAMDGRLFAPPGNIYLVGDESVRPGVAAELAVRLGLEAKVADPWKGMATDGAGLEPADLAPAEFAVATGLAQIGLSRQPFVNLLPRHETEERIRRQRQGTTTAVLCGALLFLLLALAGGRPGLTSLARQAEEVRLEQGKLQHQLDSIPSPAGFEVGLDEEMVRLQRRDNRPLEILRRLSLELPREGFRLQEFSFETGRAVILRGQSLSNGAVAEAVRTAEGLGIFDSVSLDYSNRLKEEGKNGYEFQITGKLPRPRTVSRKAAAKNSGAAEEVTGR